MYRLLIVDDEPYSADGLFEMLQETELSELDMYRAYSAQEALQWLNRVKIDIVLSDIRMPGMNGLQLHRQIKERWPRCKVIFLTGMNDNQSIRQAFREGSVDYILKTEGDEPILQSIRAAIAALEQDLHNDRFLLQAKTRLKEAMPALRNDWFRRLLQSGSEPGGMLQPKSFELLHPLKAGMQVSTVLLRVDRWPEQLSGMDRSLLSYAIENIVSEYFSSLSHLVLYAENSYFMLVLQPASGQADWDGTIRFVQGTVETVQSACINLLKLPVSVVCSHESAGWEQLPELYYRMRRSLMLGVGQGVNMMLLSRHAPGGSSRSTAATGGFSGTRERLEVSLENGRSEEVHHAIQSAFAFEGTQQFSFYLEAYYTVVTVLIGLANRLGLEDKPEADLRLDRLVNVHDHHTRDQAVSFLHETADRLLAVKRNLQDERTNRIVERVNRLIRERIHQDVTLTSLAEAVYLNPSYLSVLYKQITGQNISDYIAMVRLDIAKGLLRSSPLKIHEIAASIGFDNAGYFTRFFRKHAKIGPQEYRNQYQYME